MPRLVQRLRHGRLLRGSRRIWKLVTPLYSRYLDLRYRRSGVPVTLNGMPLRLARGAALPGHWADDRAQMVYEPETWQVLMESLREGDVAADIGASIGVFTIALGKHAVAGRVWAFEPDPYSAPLLRRNVALNGLDDTVTVIEAAVGEHAGTVQFTAIGSTMSSVGDTWSLGGETIDVPLVALDDVLERVDVLKIDVEGMEEQVLLGARKLLGDPDRRPRCLVVEIHPEPLQNVGSSPERVRELLRELGYEAQELGDVRPGKPRKWLARLDVASAG